MKEKEEVIEGQRGSKEMEGWINSMDNLLPFVGMMMFMLIQSGNMVVIKFAMAEGMNKYVTVVYSTALSTFILLPSALFLNRSERPPLTFSTLCSFFFAALLGTSAHIMSYVGIELSSPTLASAMLNLIPAFTFVLALIFRMEEVHWRQFSSQAKILGTIVSITGAFVVIFYKGQPIFKTHSLDSHNKLQSSPQSTWIFGGLFCAGDSLLGSMWYIYQTTVIKKYPVVRVVVFFQIFFSFLQSAVFTLIAVRDDPRAWKLVDKGFIVILYQAIAAILIRHVCTWCVQRAGPLFCAMFKPMGIIFTVLMGAIFLGDDLCLGSLIGAVIIVMGFYAVLWGKSKGDKVKRVVENLESPCHNVPLLQNRCN
ncbi:WAT1-related protein At5g40240-like [Abrus precatorius]|uniref:WAT1-related protein n=1 Tax=Abrus precatorius TaxID=3816 RepID=A0A8B8LXT2_ABRPR|nr:WAT1-related protein At5g40240-like [Abrus precatorius]